MLAQEASNGRWLPAPHLELLDKALVDLATGKIRRLIVTMPPRHGKSQLCSRYLPAWFVGRWPDKKVILCSYEANFAADWGAKARDILNEYGASLFGVQVRSDSNARHDWKIEGHEGGMITAGVGGPITGRGADLLIIDDPIKNAQEANSPTYRQRVWDWWTSTALTRVEPDGSVLVIVTRWHEDDLVGRLLKQDGNQDDAEEPDDEQWHTVNLPAIAEDQDPLGRKAGEALWPDRWPISKLLKRMKRLGTYVWNALFQQRPSPPEGNYFKKQWFKAIEPDRVPRLRRIARVWDLAATAAEEAKDPDWLAGTKMGYGEDGNYYILHVSRDRVSESAVESLIHSTAIRDGRSVMIRVEQEGAASGKMTAGRITRLLDGFDARTTGIPKASKMARSAAFNAACERGQVFLVAGSWNDAWLDELSSFPYGSHDDQVDSAVGAYEALVQTSDDWDPADMAEVLTYKYEQ